VPGESLNVLQQLCGTHNRRVRLLHKGAQLRGRGGEHGVRGGGLKNGSERHGSRVRAADTGDYFQPEQGTELADVACRHCIFQWSECSWRRSRVFGDFTTTNIIA
jgi:hypothetical protein